jgi:GNAT superfamily N-acetyltransferase
MEKSEIDINIRLARSEDIPALTSLIQESARILQANYYTSAQIEGALGTVFGVDRQLIQDETYFITESEKCNWAGDPTSGLGVSQLGGRPDQTSRAPFQDSANQIIGCGGWSKRKTLYGGDWGKQVEEDRLLDPRIDAAKIRAFFVHPTWARRGIGSRMMEQCESAALEAGFKAIEIIATLAGEPLYRKFGYRVSQQFEILLPNESVLPVIRMVKSFTKTSPDE